MLNYNVMRNPSVDVLERQVRLLMNGSETELRIEGVRICRGMNYNLDRISEHVIGTPFLHYDLSQFQTYAAFENFLKSEVEDRKGQKRVLVLEHAECMKDRKWGRLFSLTREMLLSKGWKIIYTFYVDTPVR